jgi:hypothetical protein
VETEGRSPTRRPVVESSQLERAERLLQLSKTAKKPLDQRLLVAAAITSVMSTPPVVVGGTAEEYWTGDAYRTTDLDLIPDPTTADIRALRKLGFRKEGRHWVRSDIPIATEFPHDATFEVRRVENAKVRGSAVRVIGIDDLYLDRLTQSTATLNVRDQAFDSLVAVALTNWDSLDWAYIYARIVELGRSKLGLGAALKSMKRRSNRKVRDALAALMASRL